MGKSIGLPTSRLRAAWRSAEDAKEIKVLISASVSNIEEGGRLVDDAGAKMEEIIHQVTQQNAALVEQSAIASSGLKQQASKLVAAISVFR